MEDESGEERLRRDHGHVHGRRCVGQPRDGDWRAAYCIYHADENLIEQRRVRYDVERTRKKIIAAGLPRLLADRLALGR